MSIAENLERVRREIDEACQRAGRDLGSVQLMAVSKTHGPKLVAEAFRAGQRLFGESRVQEWEHKREQLHSLLGEEVGEIDMHLIGNLQNNKTSKAAWLYSAVDSVDTIKVAERLNAPCAQAGKVLPVLIEVKLSDEATKHGVDPYAVSDKAGMDRHVLFPPHCGEKRKTYLFPHASQSAGSLFQKDHTGRPGHAGGLYGSL